MRPSPLQLPDDGNSKLFLHWCDGTDSGVLGCSVVAVFGDITDPASRQIGVDDLLNQVMLCWKQSRAAVDELLTAKFDLSDKVSDSADTAP